jgi:outer membrane immunogenic protein
MKFRLSFVAAALFAALSGTASAADMAVKAPPIVTPIAPTWTGWYVGAFAGYHWGNVTQSGCVGVICPSSGDNVNLWYGGLQAGYDWQMANNWVFGVQVRIPLAAESQTVNAGGVNFTVDPKYQAFVSGRVGYAINNWLPYVAFGGGLARNEISGFGASDTNTHVGFGIGGGIEYRLARNWSIDLRYMYAVFSKEEYNFGVPGENFGDKSSNVTLAINYRFGS